MIAGAVVKNLYTTAFCDSQVRPFVCGCHYTIFIVHIIVAVIAGAQKRHYTISIVHKIVVIARAHYTIIIVHKIVLDKYGSCRAESTTADVRRLTQTSQKQVTTFYTIIILHKIVHQTWSVRNKYKLGSGCRYTT